MATFTVLLLTMMVTANVVSSIVTIFYDPQTLNKRSQSKRTLQNSTGTELIIMAGFHQAQNVPALINLFDLANPTWMTPISYYPVHLVELKARASPLIIAHTSKVHEYSQQAELQSETSSILNAFERYAKRRANLTGGISMQPYTAIAPLSTMHIEINMLAEETKASLILLPFQKPISAAIRALNNNLLESTPCSIGIIIDRGLGAYRGRGIYRIVLLYHSGIDDREALLFADRMAEHSHVNLTVLRLIESNDLDDVKDEELLSLFRISHKENKRVAYQEKVLSSVEEMVASMREAGNTTDLFVVGRGGWDGSSLVMGLQEWSECPELGVIGDMLASKDFTASVLIMQHHAASDSFYKTLWRDQQQVKGE